MVYSFVKQPFNQRAHLDEYRDYQASLPHYVKPEDAPDFISGFLSSIGFYTGPEPRKPNLQATWEEGVAFFPWLDEYWTRAGRVWIVEKNVCETRMMTLRLKIASCLREAKNRDELNKLIDWSKDVNLKNWFRLGGSE